MTNRPEESETAHTMRGLARAKANLALSVGPPDPAQNGFHPICGLFASLSLADEIELSRGGETSLDIRWAADAPRPSPIDWAPESDLCVRAIRALEAHAKRDLPTRIVLTKRVPIGGGLGGGSADAAVTLSLAAKLHGLGLDHATLIAIGSALGSDVAFFLDEVEPARPAIVGGLGERVERLERPITGSILLLFPEFGCSTPEVYRAFDSEPTTLDEALVRAIASDPERIGGSAFNDLTPAACRAHPELRELIDRASRSLGRAIHMSGSGSTLFCVLEERDDHDSLLRMAGEIGLAARVCELV